MPPVRHPLGGPAPIAALTEAAGIGFDGDQPWDIEVRDGRLFSDLMRRGSLALGEGYVNGLWDCQRLDQLFTRLLTPNTAIDVMQGFDPWAHLRSVVFTLGDACSTGKPSSVPTWWPSVITTSILGSKQPCWIPGGFIAVLTGSRHQNLSMTWTPAAALRPGTRA